MQFRNNYVTRHRYAIIYALCHMIRVFLYAVAPPRHTAHILRFARYCAGEGPDQQESAHGYSNYFLGPPQGDWSAFYFRKFLVYM